MLSTADRSHLGAFRWRAKEAAIVAEQERQKAARERRDEISRLTQERTLSDLRLSAVRQYAWRSDVQRAVQNASAYKQRQTLMNELEAAINPPPPPPEPQIVYVDAAEGSDQLGTSDFNPKLWMQKPRSWF